MGSEATIACGLLSSCRFAASYTPCQIVQLGSLPFSSWMVWAMVIRIERTHGSKDVEIPISPELQAACDAMPKAHLTYIVTAYGRPRSKYGLGNDFARWASEAGLPARCRLHGLKKGGMRRLAEAGNTTHELMAISGHKIEIPQRSGLSPLAPRRCCCCCASACSWEPRGATTSATARCRDCHKWHRECEAHCSFHSSRTLENPFGTTSSCSRRHPAREGSLVSVRSSPFAVIQPGSTGVPLIAWDWRASSRS
jgi:hypothetical protein